MAEIAVESTAVPAQLPDLHVAVLGAGKMGGILLQAFLKQNLFAADQIHATVAHAEKAVARAAQWGVDVSTDNLAAARQADLILIGVKPFQVPDLIAEIKPALTPAKTLVSFAASVKTRAIEDAAGIEIPRHPRHAQHAFGSRRRHCRPLPRTLRQARADGPGAAHL